MGRTFTATGASEDGHERPLAAQASIRFTPGGTTSVATGCNEASAMARLIGGMLVSEGYVTTARGCTDRSITEQEQFVLRLLGAQPTLILEGDRLLLRSATAEIRFLDRKMADPDRSLQATRWRVAGTFDQQAASSITSPQGELMLAGGQVRTGPGSTSSSPAESLVGRAVALRGWRAVRQPWPRGRTHQPK